MHHIDLGVGERHTGRAEVEELRIDLVEGVRHIDLGEAHHTDPEEAADTGQEEAHRTDRAVEVRRTVPGVEVRRTGPGAGRIGLAEVRHTDLAERRTDRGVEAHHTGLVGAHRNVGSALVDVEGILVVEVVADTADIEVVRMLEAGLDPDMAADGRLVGCSRTCRAVSGLGKPEKFLRSARVRTMAQGRYSE